MASAAVWPTVAAAAEPDAPSGASRADLAVLAEINAARANPRAYAQALRNDIAYFHDRMFDAPGGDSIETVEGVAALNDAIADLETRSPEPPLAPDSAIAQAALRLVADQGRTAALGHVDSTNATLRDRLEGAGVWAMSMEEDIAYGPTDPHEVVRELIIDDGVPNRAHRKAIFDATMTRAGSACGPHASWGWVWVIDFTSPAMTHRPKSGAAGAPGSSDDSGVQTASSH